MEEILFLFFIGFAAAFIDAIAGGGGLISLPALLLMGLPPQTALGTNKIQSTVASLTSSLAYVKSGNVDKSLMIQLLPFTFAGSILGVILVNFLPSDWLKPFIIMLLMVMTIYTLRKKNWGTADQPKKQNRRLLLILGASVLVIGLYDGFFGPGTGSFLIFLFLFTGVNFLKAAANAKILNTTSNIAALITFMYFGSVHYQYGVIMALAGIMGALLGTKVAVTKGATIVKPLFLIMSTVLITKLLMGIF